MNTNEQQWQECPLEEATHARTATGKVYKLDADKEILLVSSVFLDPDNFEDLGITPVRKAEVCPVEFVGKAETLEDICFESVTIIKVPAEYEGKTFRCVEVQP